MSSERSCWRTSSEFGQLPPRRVVRLVARSLESSAGKNGTLEVELIHLRPYNSGGLWVIPEDGVEVASSDQNEVLHSPVTIAVVATVW